MLKAILFDIDETLIDWRGFTGVWLDVERPHIQKVYDHLRQEVAPADWPVTAEQFVHDYLRRLQETWAAGRHTLRSPHLGRLLVDTAIALGIADDAVDMHTCMTVYAWDAVPGVITFPDVPPMLDLLRERGLRFGLATNSFAPMLLRDRELAQLGLIDYFPECRYSAADVGYLKPHVEFFRTVLACLGLTADEVVFVGDNPVADIAGAQSAGMQTILRVKQPAAPLLSGLIVPDAAINTFDELPAALDNLFPGGW